MSIETFVWVKASFPDEGQAKAATDLLQQSLSDHEHELASALHELNPVENQSDYENDTINVEGIKRRKEVLSINCYTYSSEEPNWFAYSIFELGAPRIVITADSDGHRRNYYFIDGRKVSKKKFEGDKPKKPLSKKDAEINSKLFLPEGRVKVVVELLSTWWVGDIWESLGMKFRTTEGDIFYYQGRGQLTDLFFNNDTGDYDTTRKAEFSAAFERGRLDGEYVSFAKRPTKISRLDG